jgi:hypothetical protein
MTRTHTIRTNPARTRDREQPSRRQDLGVPLSVWLTDPLSGCCPVCENPAASACAHRLPAALARQVIEAFTTRGDLVYLPEAGNAAALIAAVQNGRRVLALAPTSQSAALAHDTLTEAAPAVASLAVLRRGAPGHQPTGAERHAARSALAIASPHTPTDSVALAALVDSCARALRPDGVLVITARQHPGQNLAGHLVVHAQAAGLVYLQHIVAVEATATDGALTPVPAAESEHGSNCGCHLGRPGAGRHALVHTDLLVFTRP